MPTGMSLPPPLRPQQHPADSPRPSPSRPRPAWLPPRRSPWRPFHSFPSSYIGYRLSLNPPQLLRADTFGLVRVLSGPKSPARSPFGRPSLVLPFDFRLSIPDATSRPASAGFLSPPPPSLTKIISRRCTTSNSSNPPSTSSS